MRSFHAAATLLVCSLLHLAESLPVDQPVAAVAAVAEPQEQQETLMTLDLGNPNSDQSLRDKRTIGFLRQLFPGLSQSDLNPEGENQLAGAESQQNEVRVPYIDPQQSYVDQEGAASGGNDEVEDNVEAADGDSEDRPKRGFLNFGFGGSAGAGADSSSGSGAGSGNFLFDIIRLVAGSSSSGGSSSGDSGEDGQSAGISASGEVQAERDNGYQAGIPGPITRLLIIANRGLANLMQDLILRLAQTSERIVNFKARLITAII